MGQYYRLIHALSTLSVKEDTLKRADILFVAVVVLTALQALAGEIGGAVELYGEGTAHLVSSIGVAFGVAIAALARYMPTS